MARVKLKAGAGIASLSGRIGNIVFRTAADGQTYAQQAPAPGHRPGTPAQQQWRKGRFLEAVAYGNAQKRDPAGIAYYERFRQPGSFQSVYSLALADHTHPPQVLALEAAGYQGQAGAHLRVRAHDPYGVTAVRVQVLSADGLVLEEGTAEELADDWWQYQTQQPCPPSAARQLRALATDRPGNVGERVVDLE